LQEGLGLFEAPNQRLQLRSHVLVDDVKGERLLDVSYTAVEAVVSNGNG